MAGAGNDHRGTPPSGDAKALEEGVGASSSSSRNHRWGVWRRGSTNGAGRGAGPAAERAPAAVVVAATSRVATAGFGGSLKAAIGAVMDPLLLRPLWRYVRRRWEAFGDWLDARALQRAHEDACACFD